MYGVIAWFFFPASGMGSSEMVSWHCVTQALQRLGKHSGEKPRLPIVQPSEARMKKTEAREGMHLEVQSPFTCTVSFAKGAEKQVLFAVLGLPKVKTQVLPSSSCAAAPRCLYMSDQAALTGRRSSFPAYLFLSDL